MQLIRTLLIANRGEIARRIIRTARRMGIRTVAVYSEADAAAAHVREADAAIPIGPPPARESYLAADKILHAAGESGAEAIHPGYGFLSENAEFAEAVNAAGLVWVGAPPAAIRAMGLKDAAKRLMAAAGVPVTPGYLGEDQSDARLSAEADAIGYPVLIKAVAGGGGKGMRRVGEAAEFAAALAAARREALAAFGDDRVLLETYVTRPRHIEVQVFADRFGNAVHLFERDCSLQRRHQKVIEEAPAPGMDAETRRHVCDAAVRAAQAVGYEGAGTIEFIADASAGLAADRIWFMEMNTRLQVEHPVTEAITGLDLVEWQLRVADGEALPLTQEQVRASGRAIEARLYAENPATGFLPSTGMLERLRLPDREVRVDSGFEEGDEVTPFYDPMLAKLIAFGGTRQAAAAALARACRAIEVWPVKTNAGFLARCLEHPAFLDGAFDTGFIDANAALAEAAPASPELLRSAAAYMVGQGRGTSEDPWSRLTGFRLNAPPRIAMRLETAGEQHSVELSAASLGRPGLSVAAFGPGIVVFQDGEAHEVMPARAAGEETDETAGDGAIVAPMPGRIVTVPAVNGTLVKRGEPILVLEAMKMEHTLTAPFDGTVEALTVTPGDQVREGTLLARVLRPE